MIRTQVQFTEPQLQALRQLSAQTGKSIADLVRQSVELYLRAQRGPTREELVKRALSVVGMSSSGLTDVSVNHDKYLAEDYLK